MLQKEVKNTIKKYNLIESGDNIIVGVSGGPDSICLLHILDSLKEELNFKIYVCHINHMIRKEAEEETKYVEKFCEGLGIEYFVKKINVSRVAKEEKRGIEETGRKVRYDFFDEISRKVDANKIATAHNNNDKIETIIMNILRGSGLSGLKGIEAKRDNKYIRPLINIERKDIENYCIDNKLEPKYDESNNENDYTRNKIRNIVIPYIKQEFNPNIIKTMNRLSEVTAEEDEYLNKITKETYEKICVEVDDYVDPGRCGHLPLQNRQIVLNLKKFNSIELVIKRRVILYTINELTRTTSGIEKINIDDIIKLCSNNIGNKYLSPIKNIKITIKKGKIFFKWNLDLP